MEQFKRQWWTGWIRSSEGYAVRIVGRYDLQYMDQSRRLRLFVEPLANYNDIVLDMSELESLDEQLQMEVLDKLRRAFSFAGWRLIESEADC